jgi:gamma-glutamylcyclotransferase (GGCT)/AIG2-like uncharacterized protein YtfP
VNSNLLFVYGTLRRGFDHHRLLRRLEARYVAKGTVCGQLFDLDGSPGARKPVPAPASPSGDRGPAQCGRHRITGEVFLLSNPHRAFKALDAYEGFRTHSPAGSIYVRDRTEVTLEGGERVTAWIYWLNRLPGGLRPISSGDYAKKGQS